MSELPKISWLYLIKSRVWELVQRSHYNIPAQAGPAAGTGPGSALASPTLFSMVLSGLLFQSLPPHSTSELKAPSKELFSRIFNAGSIERDWLAWSMQQQVVLKTWLGFFPHSFIIQIRIRYFLQIFNIFVYPHYMHLIFYLFLMKFLFLIAETLLKVP